MKNVFFWQMSLIFMVEFRFCTKKLNILNILNILKTFNTLKIFKLAKLILSILQRVDYLYII